MAARQEIHDENQRLLRRIEAEKSPKLEPMAQKPPYTEARSEETPCPMNPLAQNKSAPVSSTPSITLRHATNRPTELRIGTHRVPITLSYQILVETADWIIRQGVKLPEIPNFIQHREDAFANSAVPKRLMDGSYIEAGDSQEVLITKARRLLDICNFGEVTLDILLQDGSIKHANRREKLLKTYK